MENIIENQVLYYNIEVSSMSNVEFDLFHSGRHRLADHMGFDVMLFPVSEGHWEGIAYPMHRPEISQDEIRQFNDWLAKHSKVVEFSIRHTTMSLMPEHIAQIVEDLAEQVGLDAPDMGVFSIN
jgi:hypothetical protein